MKKFLAHKFLAPKALALATVLALGSSLITSVPASADGYEFKDTVESKTVQTPLCKPVSSVCNDKFSFGFLGNTLQEGTKDLPTL